MQMAKLMVKPTHRCNLNCTYCYDKQTKIREDMTLSLVEDICKFSTSTSRNTLWCWHGGEPLMMPLEFYKAAHSILMKYGITNVAMQSNGTLLTREHIETFKEYGWKVSFSFDGKLNSNTRGDYKKLLENLALYKEIYTTPSIIKVVDSSNVKSFSDDYDFFKELGFKNVQFNRVFITPTAHMINEGMFDEYLEQYALVFDKWVNDPNPLNVRNFDEYVGFIIGHGEFLCGYKGECISQFMNINPIGDLTPCDRWFPEEFTFGNIKDFKNIQDVHARSPQYAKMVDIHYKRIEACKNSDCEIFGLCNGGCNANAVSISGGLEPDRTDCYLRKKELYHVMNVLNNIKIEDIKNPNLQKTLIFGGFRNKDIIGGRNE